MNKVASKIFKMKKDLYKILLIALLFFLMLASAVRASGLTIEQINSIIVLIRAFGGSASDADNVELALTGRSGTKSTPTVTPTTTYCVAGATSTAGMPCTVRPTPNPAITVLSPNGSEVYKPGTPINIIWSVSAMPVNTTYSVSLLDNQGSSTIKAIATGVISTNYLWYVPRDVPYGQYKMRVGGSGYSDISDSSFSVASSTSITPAITNVFPKTSTTTAPNVPITVSWNTNFPPESSVQLTIRLSSAKNAANNVFLTKNLSNASTSASWFGNLIGYDGKEVVPDTYQIYVVGSVNGYDKIQGVSIGKLTVEAPSAPVSITVLSPNGGESYKTGEAMAIKWKTFYAYGSVAIELISLQGSVYDSKWSVVPVRNSSTSNNTASFATVISPSIPLGLYRVKVFLFKEGDSTQSRMNALATDQSDSYFTIVAQSPAHPLAATCSASPSSMVLGASDSNSITWSAQPSGGFGNYIYEWGLYSEGAISNGALQSVSSGYSYAGTKQATVRVSDGTSSVSASCSATITAATTTAYRNNKDSTASILEAVNSVLRRYGLERYIR